VAFLDVPLILLHNSAGYFLSQGHVVVGMDFEGGRVDVKVELKLTR
jgi:hypothetical protein